jgi:hypothetical protein
MVCREVGAGRCPGASSPGAPLHPPSLRIGPSLQEALYYPVSTLAPSGTPEAESVTPGFIVLLLILWVVWRKRKQKMP